MRRAVGAILYQTAASPAAAAAAAAAALAGGGAACRLCAVPMAAASQALKAAAPAAAAAAGRGCQGMSAFSSTSGYIQQQQQQQQQPGDLPPSQAFLDSLVDYEKLGVPKAAGVAPAAAAAAAGGGGVGVGGGGDEAGSRQNSSSSSRGFDLSTMRQLLAAMGNPQQQLSVVHIAGTKGKGSVAALLSGVLRAAGYRVGTYTSPHMFDIRERIVVGAEGAPHLRPAQPGSSSSSRGSWGWSGQEQRDASAAAAAAAAVPAAVPVTAEQFEALAVQAAEAVAALQAEAPAQQQQGHNSPARINSTQSSNPSTPSSSSSGSSSQQTQPSHFEVVTAMALQHFVNQRVDIAVIETGLGGATDATNVFGPRQLQAAVLTAVGLDHVEALGGSLGSIAAAKAGILKPGVPVVVGPQAGGCGEGGSGGLGGSSGDLGGSSAGGNGSSADGSGGSGADGSGDGSSGNAADVVLRVFREVAGAGDMRCPLLLAEEVVKVVPAAVADAADSSSSGSSSSSNNSSSSSILILPGPGDHLARQLLSVSADTAPIAAAAAAAAAGTAAAHDSSTSTSSSSSTSSTSRSTSSCTSTSSSSSSGGSGASSLTTLDLPSVQLQLVGQHQAGNVQTAVATALLLAARGWRGIDQAAVLRGLESSWLPGRFQVARLPDSPTHFVLDGAHTADSAAALAQTLRGAFPDDPVVLVVAMAADKQHREVLQALRAIRPRVAVFTSVPIAGSHARSAPPGTLAAHWQAAAMLSSCRPFRCRELIQAGLGAAVEKARHELGAYGGRGVVVVTGSLHAVAAGLKLLQLA